MAEFKTIELKNGIKSSGHIPKGMNRYLDFIIDSGNVVANFTQANGVSGGGYYEEGIIHKIDMIDYVHIEFLGDNAIIRYKFHQ